LIALSWRPGGFLSLRPSLTSLPSVKKSVFVSFVIFLFKFLCSWRFSGLVWC
jgi:hypothetical protein